MCVRRAVLLLRSLCDSFSTFEIVGEADRKTGNSLLWGHESNPQSPPQDAAERQVPVFFLERVFRAEDPPLNPSNFACAPPQEDKKVPYTISMPILFLRTPLVRGSNSRTIDNRCARDFHSLVHLLAHKWLKAGAEKYST